MNNELLFKAIVGFGLVCLGTATLIWQRRLINWTMKVQGIFADSDFMMSWGIFVSSVVALGFILIGFIVFIKHAILLLGL